MGHYEYLVNYFTFLAQEVREYLAEMGFKSLNDIVGHTELIETKPSVLEFGRILYREEGTLHFTGDIKKPSLPLGMREKVLDQRMVEDSACALSQQKPVELNYAIHNTDRAVGTMLSGVVAQ